MKDLKIKGRGKINLSLDVIGKREDGYHKVKMIMQQIDLCDEISIKRIEKGISVSTNIDFLPVDENNIAYKAAMEMKKVYNIKIGFAIHIHKNIPISAGMAGGSTDAAAVLKGISQMMDLNASEKELMVIGARLGADVPFCIHGGCAIAEGIGEELTPIEGIKAWILVCKPNVRVSTAEVYKKLRVEDIKKHPDTELLVQAVKKNDLYMLGHNMVNVLESVTEKEHGIITDIKKKMMECQAIGAMMTGSGPTVFSLYKDYNKAKKAHEKLIKVYGQTLITKSYNREEK